MLSWKRNLQRRIRIPISAHQTATPKMILKTTQLQSLTPKADQVVTPDVALHVGDGQRHRVATVGEIMSVMDPVRVLLAVTQVAIIVVRLLARLHPAEKMARRGFGHGTIPLTDAIVHPLLGRLLRRLAATDKTIMDVEPGTIPRNERGINVPTVVTGQCMGIGHPLREEGTGLAPLTVIGTESMRGISDLTGGGMVGEGLLQMPILEDGDHQTMNAGTLIARDLIQEMSTVVISTDVELPKSDYAILFRLPIVCLLKMICLVIMMNTCESISDICLVEECTSSICIYLRLVRDS